MKCVCFTWQWSRTAADIRAAAVMEGVQIFGLIKSRHYLAGRCSRCKCPRRNREGLRLPSLKAPALENSSLGLQQRHARSELTINVWSCVHVISKWNAFGVVTIFISVHWSLFPWKHSQCSVASLWSSILLSTRCRVLLFYFSATSASAGGVLTVWVSLCVIMARGN